MISLLSYETEQRYKKKHFIKMSLLEVVLTFILLDNANQNHQQQVLITHLPNDLQFKNRKSTLRRTFCENRWKVKKYIYISTVDSIIVKQKMT